MIVCHVQNVVSDVVSSPGWRGAEEPRDSESGDEVIFQSSDMSRLGHQMDGIFPLRNILRDVLECSWLARTGWLKTSWRAGQTAHLMRNSWESEPVDRSKLTCVDKLVALWLPTMKSTQMSYILRYRQSSTLFWVQVFVTSLVEQSFLKNRPSATQNHEINRFNAAIHTKYLLIDDARKKILAFRAQFLFTILHLTESLDSRCLLRGSKFRVTYTLSVNSGKVLVDIVFQNPHQTPYPQCFSLV